MYMSASPPDAPPLSDTTIGCFIRLFFWIAACIMRAIWSDAPPAPAATTISTGLLGSQASVGALASATASAAVPPTIMFFATGIASLLEFRIIRFWAAGREPALPLVVVAHSAALCPRCKGAGTSQGCRDAWSPCLLEHDLFPKTGIHPGSKSGAGFFGI